jgi:hypothetical protein
LGKVRGARHTLPHPRQGGFIALPGMSSGERFFSALALWDLDAGLRPGFGLDVARGASAEPGRPRSGQAGRSEDPGRSVFFFWEGRAFFFARARFVVF